LFLQETYIYSSEGGIKSKATTASIQEGVSSIQTSWEEIEIAYFVKQWVAWLT